MVLASGEMRRVVADSEGTIARAESAVSRANAGPARATNPPSASTLVTSHRSISPFVFRSGDGGVLPFAFSEYLFKASELVLLVGRSAVCREHGRVP